MSSKIRAVVFGIDDVLYDATYQTSNARLAAVRAMIEAGLPVDLETGYRTLETIVKELGPDSTRHFDTLMERLGLKWTPRVVAAGVVAYRETNPIYLKAYPDTMPTILRLRDKGLKLGCASDGKSVKQWQKLVSLGLQHCFHAVVISEDMKSEKLNQAVVKEVLRKLEVDPKDAIFIGTRPNAEIAVASDVGATPVRLLRGESKTEKGPATKPFHEVNRLSEIFELIDRA
ncbi:MAG TPA: HAD family hydrolase [Terriglobales bacterium]|nr:HAD family hydrolase [Terriglobales bacterium]